MCLRLALILPACLLLFFLTACGTVSLLPSDSLGPSGSITVTDMETGETVALTDSDAKDSLMDCFSGLRFERAGSCTGADYPIYKVSIWFSSNDVQSAELYVNEDGSVCKDGSRYTLSGVDHTVKDAFPWESLFSEKELPSTIDAPLPANFRSNLVLAPQSETLETSGTGSPFAAPKGMTIIQSDEIAFVPPWHYYRVNAAFEGLYFTAVGRVLTADGEDVWEVVFSVKQGASRAHAIEYVKGSLEQSKNTYLYFTLLNGQNKHRSLYAFHLESEQFLQILPEPCSNMTLVAGSRGQKDRQGWILYENIILPIQLKTATFGENAVSIEQLGGLPEISEHFFYGFGAGGDTKFATISPLAGNNLRISIMEFNTHATTPTRFIASYMYDSEASQISLLDE